MNATGDSVIDSMSEQSKSLLAGAWAFYYTAAHAETGDSPSVPNKIDLRPAILVNVGYAYELSLKALLASRGRTKQELRKIGHNLIEALSMAIELGLPQSADVEKQISLIASSFADHSLRYISFRNLEVSSDCMRVLHDHMEAISKLLLLIEEF